MTQNFSMDSLREELLHPKNEPGRLLAIVDGCRAGKWLSRLIGAGHPSFLLGLPGPGTTDVYRQLPWLLELDAEGRLLSDLLEQYGRGWGIFLRSEAKPEEVAGHFTTLSTAVLPDGQTTWFRYYEPCFFRSFARFAGEDNLKRLYGDTIRSFYAENPRKMNFESFRPPEPCGFAVKSGHYLVLSPELLERLDEARMDELKRILTLQYLSGEETVPDDRETALLEAHIEELVERASRYGLEDLASLSVMVDAAKYWGWDFDVTEPRVKTVLNDKGAAGWTRCRVIGNLLEKSKRSKA